MNVLWTSRHCKNIYTRRRKSSSILWAVRLSWLENASCLGPLFSAGDFGPQSRSDRQTDLVLACDQDSLAGLCVQDYKSLCSALTICSTLVNIQTQTDSILLAYMKSSASGAKSHTAPPPPGNAASSIKCDVAAGA